MELKQQVIRDLRNSTTIEVGDDAVLVVGSGAAGIALAERLADRGRHVVLLESGAATAEDADDAHRDLNRGLVAGLPYTGLDDGRMRTLGGTTQLWHGQCMRLHDIDLRARDWIPGSGWPIDARTLDAHYAAAERWLGVSSRGYGEQRWADHPNLPAVSWTPTRLEHDFTEYTPDPILARTHRARLETDVRIEVVVNATAGRLRLSGSRVSGVDVHAPDGRVVPVEASTVVLAGGAIENARLLMLSDPAGTGLGTGREHTGRYLQDHPTIRIAKIVSDDFRTLQDRYIALRKGRRRLFPKVRLAEAAQREYGLTDASAVFVHEHDDPGRAAARRLVSAARARRRPEHAGRDALAALRAPAPIARDAYRRYARGMATAGEPSAVWLQIWLEQVPDPNSTITLSAERDAFGLARAEVSWAVGATEIETSRRMAGWIADDLARLGIARVEELPPMRDDDAWRANVLDAYHPSGTTRMSADPSGGVVDPDLSVHGVDGLHVLGASVFPVAGYANPTLTIVALAMRLGDHLARPAVHLVR